MTRAWAWTPPLLALGLLPWLYAGDNNAALFLNLNHAFRAIPPDIWSALTMLGNTVVALSVTLLLFRHRRRLAYATLIASLPATALSQTLKILADQPRPYRVLGDQVEVIGPTLLSHAFPSGHTTTLFVLASVLIVGARAREWAPVILLVAGLGALSRIATGAHWPADLLGGIACGWLSGLFGLTLAQRYLASPLPWLDRAIEALLLGCAGYLLLFYNSGYPLARPFEQILALAVLMAYWLPLLNVRKELT